MEGLPVESSRLHRIITLDGDLRAFRPPKPVVSGGMTMNPKPPVSISSRGAFRFRYTFRYTGEYFWLGSSVFAGLSVAKVESRSGTIKNQSVAHLSSN
ncbi:hypothetical protein D3C84_1031280 [compost metagenome]